MNKINQIKKIACLKDLKKFNGTYKIHSFDFGLIINNGDMLELTRKLAQKLEKIYKICEEGGDD